MNEVTQALVKEQNRFIMEKETHRKRLKEYLILFLREYSTKESIKAKDVMSSILNQIQKDGGMTQKQWDVFEKFFKLDCQLDVEVLRQIFKEFIRGQEQ